jgi:hypothetical protein
MSKARDRDRERMRQMGDLVARIHREWWRPLLNRHRRQQVRALYEEGEREYAERQARRAEFRAAQERRQPHGAE